MADLEAVAAFLDINEQYDLAMAFDRDEEGNTSMAREHRKSAACHRAAAAACRELAKRHALPKHKQNAICWEPSMSGLPHDKEVADIVLARRDTDAALAEIE